uniref:LITAF domain-containing protein n=1 Tax=Caenorhabditis tropicalis TaxID=1561998 RepID=A0A1I7V1I9_9PELO
MATVVHISSPKITDSYEPCLEQLTPRESSKHVATAGGSPSFSDAFSSFHFATGSAVLLPKTPNTSVRLVDLFWPFDKEDANFEKVYLDSQKR